MPSNDFPGKFHDLGVDQYTLGASLGPDDNHDDMLIRAVFRPSTNVPEPATLALFGLGLLGIGLARRKKI